MDTNIQLFKFLTNNTGSYEKNMRDMHFETFKSWITLKKCKHINIIQNVDPKVKEI